MALANELQKALECELSPLALASELQKGLECELLVPDSSVVLANELLLV
jgi:hypothetical protein